MFKTIIPLFLKCVLYSLTVYFLFFAVYAIGHFYFEIGNPSVVLTEFLIATAIAIFICVPKGKP
ncbi:hypothetical protein IMSAGC018_00820 [Lachnospiraceae bacterium]|nr:hypothetical protein IMSAGC018_00820 [Lachnospiraceae bacterium]